MDRLTTEFHTYRNLCTERQITLDVIPQNAKGDFVVTMNVRGKIRIGTKVWKYKEQTEAFLTTYKAIYERITKSD